MLSILFGYGYWMLGIGVLGIGVWGIGVWGLCEPLGVGRVSLIFIAIKRTNAFYDSNS